MTVGSVCTLQAVTPRKPSQNALIKTSPTITAHPDALTFTPPMNTVSYSVSLSHSLSLTHTHTLLLSSPNFETMVFVTGYFDHYFMQGNFKSPSDQHDLLTFMLECERCQKNVINSLMYIQNIIPK